MNDLQSSEVKSVGPPTKPDKPILFGFGGWLYVFAIGLTISFFRNLKNLYDNYLLMNSADFTYLTDINSDGYNSLWFPTLIFEMFAQSSLALMAIFIAYFCIKIDYKFKLLSLIYIPYMLVVCIIDTLLMLNIQNYYTEELFGSDVLYTPIYQSLVYSAIWIPYFLVSKRVNNTFIRGATKAKVFNFENDKFKKILAAIVGLISFAAAYIAVKMLFS